MALAAEMSAVIAGIGGTLLPTGYLATTADGDARDLGCPTYPAGLGRALERAWARGRAVCGPASGARVLFDLIAEPLLRPLGFNVRSLRFVGGCAHVALATPAGRAVALVLLPWASRPSSAWRDLARLAAEMGARWGFVLAPPFLSLVPVAGHTTRHSIDFNLTCLGEEPFSKFAWLLARAEMFDEAGPNGAAAIDLLAARASLFQEGVRQDLQIGVTEALQALAGTATGPRRVPTFRRTATEEALTLIYRILFLLFVESRETALLESRVYERSYSLRTLAGSALDGRSAGSWDALAAITRLARLGSRAAVLEVPAFNGRLFARSSAPSLEERRTARRVIGRTRERDAALGRALVALTSRHTRRGRELIHYRDLGVEQLGTVYERLLDLVSPTGAISSGGQIARAHSRARKESGTFYTPRALADFIVRRTLAPLVDGARSDSILSLRVLDPSMGSGACLVAACRYLAAAYERAVIDEGRASHEDFDEDERGNVRRLVAERCLAGVDRNPTAVELARLSIWLTTLAYGKPLGFLDHRLRVGDSLVGAWPTDLSRTGTRSGRTPPSLPLFDLDDLGHALSDAAPPLAELRFRRDDTVADVHAKAAAWRRLTSVSSSLEPWRRAATLWCARWFWPDENPPNGAETRALIAGLLGRERTLPPQHLEARWLMAAATASDRDFFHWPLEFPDCFFNDSGEMQERPGFDAVIGNPPWEMLRQDEAQSNHGAGAVVRYVRESGQYPSCGHGHLNLYQAFVDRALALTRPGGRIGLALPWGLATDDGSARLRARLLDECALDTIVGLDNARGLFPIHRGLRFGVVTATRGRTTSEIRARFGVMASDEIDALPGRDDPARSSYPMRLTRSVIDRVGGPLRRIPDVRRDGDLALLERVTSAFPALGSAAGWNVSFGRELNSTESRSALGTTGLPVIDGKHVTPFATATSSASRITREAALRLLPRAPFERPRLAYRDVSGVGNRHALISAIVPAGVVTTHTLFCLKEPLAIERQQFLCAMFNSLVLNAVVRMLMGTHVTTSLVEALPVPTWTGSRADRRLAAAAAELAAEATQESAAWLQATVAHRYGLTAGEFHHVLDASPLMPEAERDAAWAAFHVGAR